MPQLSTPSLHHIALTVTSFETSLPWYERVFGIGYQMEEAHEGGVGKLLTDPEWRLIIVLHEHEANEREQFSPTRTGLDHVGFVVPGRADLEAWQAHLEEHGVARTAVADRPLTQSAIADRPYGSVLVFRDPDNIQLEFFAPPSS
jgi:glyoxylase I family protein